MTESQFVVLEWEEFGQLPGVGVNIYAPNRADRGKSLKARMCVTQKQLHH